MNRVEFMSRLEQLLEEIPISERDEAITYYNDYFNDAGVENEQEVIESLGSPERVADTIKAGLGGKVIDGEYTETGYKTEAAEGKEEVALTKDASGQTDDNSTKKDYSKQRPNENKLLKVILYVLIAILLCPVRMPLAGGLFGVAVAVLVVILVCLMLVILLPFIGVVVGIALVISGIFTLVVGLIKLFVAPAAAVGLIGIGLLLGGGGLLAAVIGGWLLAKLVPSMIRGFVNLCRKPFAKKGGRA